MDDKLPNYRETRSILKGTLGKKYEDFSSKDKFFKSLARSDYLRVASSGEHSGSAGADYLLGAYEDLMRSRELSTAEKEAGLRMVERRAERTLKQAENAFYSANSTAEKARVADNYFLAKSVLKAIREDVVSGKSLTSKLPVTAAILSFGASIFFFSSDVTGNVVGLSNTASSWVGGILVLIGLVALGSWIKSRKRNKVVSVKVTRKKR